MRAAGGRKIRLFRSGILFAGDQFVDGLSQATGTGLFLFSAGDPNDIFFLVGKRKFFKKKGSGFAAAEFFDKIGGRVYGPWENGPADWSDAGWSDAGCFQDSVAYGELGERGYGRIGLFKVDSGPNVIQGDLSHALVAKAGNT